MRRLVSFFLLLFVLLVSNFLACGQQDPQYTNNMFYKLGVNPGYAGAENAINGLLLNRYQWTGAEGAPKTLVFSADAAINVFGAPGGIGINLISDKIAFYDNMWINLNYSYKVNTSIGTLGLGVSPGVYNFSVNGEWDVPQGGMYTPPDSDAGIPKGEASKVALDLGLGVYLQSNRYYAGLSVTHLNQPEVMYDDLSADYLVRHYYLSGGYNIKLSDPLFEVRPSFLFKWDVAIWQLDVNVNVFYDDRFWGGMTYRVQDALSLLMGMDMDNGLRVGYSFDLVTSAMSHAGATSHEIFVGYSLDLERKRDQKYKSIRFL